MSMTSTGEGDQYSQTTASSSGLTDSDVSILGDQRISNKISSLERRLRARYSVSSITPAGRTKLENLISKVRHSNVIVVILTKLTAKQYQGFLQALPPQPRSGSLTLANTLILYEKGVTKIYRGYQNIVQLLCSLNELEKVATLISGFIEAAKIAAKKYGENNENYTEKFRKDYCDCLLHSILNPLKSASLYGTSINDLKLDFDHRYGSFSRMLVGELEQHIICSSGFLLHNDRVVQTKIGNEFLRFWNSEVNKQTDPKSELMKPTTPRNVSSKSAVIRVQDHRESPTPSNTASLAIKSSNETTDRTGKWVKSSAGSRPERQVDIDWSKTEPLRKLLYEFDSRYSFFLISGKGTPPDKFQGIVTIPWLQVFDFDSESREKGLLFSVYDKLQHKRMFSISHGTGAEALKPILNKSTHWYFPLGTSSESGSVYDKSPLAWHNEYKSILDEQFSSIANFCITRTQPVFLILWYDVEKKSARYLDWFLSDLDPAFPKETLPKKLILCVNEPSKCVLEDVIEKYELEESTVVILPEVAFKYLANSVVQETASNSLLRLPRREAGFDDDNIVEVSESDRLWIEGYLDILSWESQGQISQRKSKNFGHDFVKGGVITWDELASKELAVERTRKDVVFKYIENEVLQKQKSFVLRILHAPGGGGTTFARQLLWEMHFKVPCGVVVPSPNLSVTQISERVRFLNDKTHLPVVLLIDGRSEYEIEQLYENCKYAVVILHVLRCSQNIPKSDFNSSKTFRLSGKVTVKEATALSHVISHFASGNQSAINKLTQSVKKDGEIFLFEYGLTAFEHEYKGLSKYVQGYLKLYDQHDGLQHLQKWQKVLAYLSLAQYYGQSGLHRQTFVGLLKGRRSKEFVSLNDLEYSAQQFIIEDQDYEWKIRHYMVAKEILEQILSNGIAPSHNWTDGHLSRAAKRNLHLLVNYFIEMVKNAASRNRPEHVLYILQNMIIRRDNLEVDYQDNPDGTRRRCVLSKLLEDVTDEENRVQILEQLTKAFPKEPDFHAHLGRLLNIMKKFSEAEKSLQTALKIRLQEKKRRKEDPSSNDSMLGRIHHMFGVGYTTRAEGELRALKSVRQGVGSYDNLLNYVKKAVDHFSKVRRYATHNLSYGYLGEVNARLLVADFVRVKFVKGCSRAFDGNFGETYGELFEYVRESFSECDQLLAECQHNTSEQQLQRVPAFKKCIDKFILCYRYSSTSMSISQQKNPSSLMLRRCYITSVKMKYTFGNKGLHIENVSQKKDLQYIIDMYEKTLRENLLTDNEYNSSVSVDILEWLDAIRHPLCADKYQLTRIFQYVEPWEQQNESSHAMFYLYVINFLFAVFYPGQSLKEEYYNKSKELKAKLQSLRYRRKVPGWRREWIANHNNFTIRKLISSKRMGEWDKEKRFWKSESSVLNLAVFTGTVTLSNHPLKGSITLDAIESNHGHKIEVYFVPKLYNLDSSKHGDQRLRVEFCIGFSFLHGAEAFSVIPLKSRLCRNCKISTEAVTINAGDGKCRKCNLAH